MLEASVPESISYLSISAGGLASGLLGTCHCSLTRKQRGDLGYGMVIEFENCFAVQNWFGFAGYIYCEKRWSANFEMFWIW